MARRAKKRGKQKKYRFKYDLLGLKVRKPITVVKGHYRKVPGKRKKVWVKKHKRGK